MERLVGIDIAPLILTIFVTGCKAQPPVRCASVKVLNDYKGD